MEVTKKSPPPFSLHLSSQSQSTFHSSCPRIPSSGAPAPAFQRSPSSRPTAAYGAPRSRRRTKRRWHATSCSWQWSCGRDAGILETFRCISLSPLPLGRLFQDLLQLGKERRHGNDNLLVLIHLQVGRQQSVDVVQPLQIRVLLLQSLDGRRVVQGRSITTLFAGQGDLIERKNPLVK